MEQVSDLNLVNCLLVFLLSGLEKTFSVINHLFQTVLLVETKTEERAYENVWIRTCVCVLIITQ